MGQRGYLLEDADEIGHNLNNKNAAKVIENFETE